MEESKNLCPYSDGLDNLGKKEKAWGNTHTKNLYVTGSAEIQSLTVGGSADVPGYVKKAGDTMTGNLTVPKVIGNLQGKADTAGLADKASTLDGDAGLWNYLHRKGDNFAPPTTNAAVNALGMFISSYNKANVFKNQPVQYGQLINIPYGKDNSESTQFWIEQNSGKLCYRGGNGSIVVNDTPFTRFLDTNDLSSLGVVAGNVSNANAWWVKLGGTIPLIIQGGKYFSLNYGNAGSSEKCTLPIAFTKPLFATAISDSVNDDIIPHILGMWNDAITVSMDQVANGAWRTNIYLLAIGTA